MRKIYPDRFETSNPRLLDRKDPRSAPALETVDGLLTLAHDHRLSAYVPDLEPTVKWRAGQPPDLNWRFFDSVAEPWLDGDLFADGVPIPHWPLPDVTALANYPVEDRLQYWQEAANHFDANGWLDRSPAVIRQQVPVPPSEFVSLSAEAGDLLRSHPRVKVQLPLEKEAARAEQRSADSGDGDRPGCWR